MKIVRKIRRYNYLFLDFIDNLLRRIKHKDKPMQISNFTMANISTGKVVLHVDSAKVVHHGMQSNEK